ncbi:MAG: hypothetical protein WDA41_07965 [Candidatus Neomarinimicrobiota bacterium]|jgi:hypothetical protein|nr:hypothetical protein [Dehalococcoidales bacterium]
MFDIDKVFGFDDKMAQEGVKMFLDAKGEQYFLVRRIPNPDYERMLSREFRRNKRLLEMETPESELLSQKLMAEVLAKTVLIGWEGIAVKGKKLPFSVEGAAKILTEYPNLRSAVLEFGQDTKNFRPTDDVEEVKKP